jgi:predicted transcriptional regulator
MIQSIDKELYKYWELLDASQKKSILSMIKSFIQPKSKDSHISLEQYNKELDEAMARIDAGDFISHEDVLKDMDKW